MQFFILIKSADEAYIFFQIYIEKMVSMYVLIKIIVKKAYAFFLYL